MDGIVNELLYLYKSVPHRGQGTIAIFSSDLLTLRPGEYINDRIIDFWLSYQYNNGGVHEADKGKVVILSSLFYTSLLLQQRQVLANKRRRRRQAAAAAQGPASKRRKVTQNPYSPPGSTPKNRFNWTKKIKDLFLKDFIFVPIALEQHWFLAVVCYAGMVFDAGGDDEDEDVDVESVDDDDKDQDKAEDETCAADLAAGRDDISDLDNFLKRSKRKIAKHPEEPAPRPMILILDSFQDYDIDHAGCGKVLRRFLNMEWQRRYPGTRLHFSEKNIGLHILDVPQQNNTTDCGLFLLRFFELFFLSPLPRCPPFPSTLSKDWDEPDEFYGKRESIYGKLYSLIRHNPDDDRFILIPIIPFPSIKKKLKEEGEERKKVKVEEPQEQEQEQENLDVDVDDVGDDDDEEKKKRLELLGVRDPLGSYDWDFSDDEDDYVPLVQCKCKKCNKKVQDK